MTIFRFYARVKVMPSNISRDQKGDLLQNVKAKRKLCLVVVLAAGREKIIEKERKKNGLR